MPPDDVRPTGIYRLGQSILAGGVGLDTGSTIARLMSGNSHEANPILGNNPSNLKLAGAKAATTLPLLWAMKKLREAGHPTLAGIIGAASGSIPLMAGIRNLNK